ncbi:MAG: twin-arginine translocation signal domain-containing protein [Chloroflexi bacterium]|nr:twin-arginine translocation signal domain-containing protein [Chloroflexota bacterium]MBP8056395.1 twin-arginine translocation signal domain-containing protein [Chloroflexota bacterium]
MVDEMMDENISRRGFLKAMVATAAAATTVGVGAVWLKGKTQPVVTTMPVAAAPRVINPVVYDPTANSDLMAQLVAAQAENVRLQAALDAAARQINVINGADGNNAAAIQNLQLELSNANDRAGVLAGLVALFDQLEGVDLSNLLQSGLTTVGEAVTDLVDDIPTLEEAITAGQMALQELENDVPLIENGRTWLEEQVNRLEGYYQGVESFLREAVEAAGNFLEMLNQWFQDILKWLPFGMGDKAANVMNALTTLLLETPNTISGVRTAALPTMDNWFKRQPGQELPIHTRLIQPLRDNTLAKAGLVGGKASTLQTKLNESLNTPVNTALLARQTIREQIAAYRHRHQL